MAARPGSPNYCWFHAGYRVIKKMKPKRREIYDDRGELVDVFNFGGNGIIDGHTMEMMEIRKRGIFNNA